MLVFSLLLFACGKQVTPQDDPVPGVPQNVALHNAEETSLTFQWDPVEGATGYAWRLTSGGVQVKEGSASKRKSLSLGWKKLQPTGFRCVPWRERNHLPTAPR